MKAKAAAAATRSRAKRAPLVRRSKNLRPPLVAVPVGAVKPAELILEHTTEVGRRKFLEEMHDALESSDPARQMWYVIDSRYRTIVVFSDPAFPKSLEAAKKRTGETLTLEQLRERLAL